MLPAFPATCCMVWVIFPGCSQWNHQWFCLSVLWLICQLSIPFALSSMLVVKNKSTSFPIITTMFSSKWSALLNMAILANSSAKWFYIPKQYSVSKVHINGTAWEEMLGLLISSNLVTPRSLTSDWWSITISRLLQPIVKYLVYLNNEATPKA